MAALSSEGSKSSGLVVLPPNLSVSTGPTTSRSGTLTTSGADSSRTTPAARKRLHRYRRAEYGGIVIERDYTEGMHLRFVTDYPDELASHGITAEQFDYTISTINQIFDAAESWSFFTCCESFLACVSLYSLWLIWTPYYDRQVARFRRFLQEQNETVYNPRGLHCLDPIHNGLLHFQIIITSAEI
jgi:hypothetical protein